MSLVQERDVIKEVLKYNEKEYNFLKLAEELAELSEVIIKTIVKKPEYKPTVDKLIEEMGDVELRMTLLKRQEGIDTQVQERIDKKGSRLLQYIDAGKYKGGV